MTRIRLDEHLAEAAVLGGAVLGGGGGGSIQDGMERAKTAVRLGSPVLISLDELNETDLILTASVVGAPAAAEKYLRPVDHIRAMKLLLEKRPLKFSGIIANENGAGSGVNGWLQAAMLGVPMVDAPANGRAHPTGLMGAMGLHRVKDYTSIQAAAGGNPEMGRYLEIVVEGALQPAANLIRYASVQAGGTVAVARDPVTVEYIKNHAAPGGTTQAIRVGEAMIGARNQGAQAVIKSIVSVLSGEISVQGEVVEIRLETIGGYDVGLLTVKGDRKGELTFWNEFMTLEIEERRKATFPDLITVLSLENGIPVSSAEVKKGQNIVVLVVPRANLILGEGVLLPETLQEAERAIGKPLVL
jgi:uncharacterized protein